MDEEFPGVDRHEHKEIGEDGDSITIPKDAMAENSEGGLVRIVFIAFHRLEDILVPVSVESEPNSVPKIVNSRIISASLGKGRHIQFSQEVRIVLRHLRTENVTNPSCVFWDYTTRYLSFIYLHKH